MKTLKELADIGAAAALQELKKITYIYRCMWINKDVAGDAWSDEEPARQAFAAAVRDAVLAELATTSDSSPTSKTIPLTVDDIRATDEFREIDGDRILTVSYWSINSVFLTVAASISYQDLAANYLRRQHGSNEWKPCTKEVTV